MTADRVVGDRRVIRVHAWIILLTTVVTMGLAVLAVLAQPREYEAQAQVELLATPTRGAPIPPNMGTERQVALSGSVARDAASRMGIDLDVARAGLSASAVADTQVLLVTYTASSERRALRGAEAFTQSYTAARNARSKARTVAVISQPALLPAGTPVSTPLLLTSGLLAGLGLGTALAFLWDRASGRVRSSGELTRSGLPVLAAGLVLPDAGRIDTRLLRSGGAGHLVGRLATLTDHRRDGVRILVTSARDADADNAPGAAALTAAALAHAGRQVVLVDTGGRGSSLGELARGPSAADLGDAIAGRCSPAAATRPTAVPGLRVVASGSPRHRLPYDSDSLSLVLGQLAQHSIVVVAGPPLLTSAEAWLLLDQADVALVVAGLPSLRRRDADRVAEMLGSVGGTSAGWLVCASRRRGARRSRPAPERTPRQEPSVLDQPAGVGVPRRP